MCRDVNGCALQPDRRKSCERLWWPSTHSMLTRVAILPKVSAFSVGDHAWHERLRLLCDRPAHLHQLCCR